MLNSLGAPNQRQWALGQILPDIAALTCFGQGDRIAARPSHNSYDVAVIARFGQGSYESSQAYHQMAGPSYIRLRAGCPQSGFASPNCTICFIKNSCWRKKVSVLENCLQKTVCFSFLFQKNLVLSKPSLKCKDI